MSGGKQLSFPTFKSNIQKESDSVGKILECALFLRLTNLAGSRKSWKKFADSFFGYYQPVILEYFGYKPDVLKIPKVKVIDKGLFMAVLTAMHKTGMFDCYASELAAAVVAVFDVKLQLSSIQQDLYDQLLEYEDVLGFFNNYRKYEF